MQMLLAPEFWIGLGVIIGVNIILLTLGLVISIPLVVFGATILMVLMERYPIMITLGAAVLGWTTGDMAYTDPAVDAWVKANAAWLEWIAPGAGAVFVVALGTWLARKSAGAENTSPVESEPRNP